MDCPRARPHRAARAPPPARTGCAAQRTICSSCSSASSARGWTISAAFYRRTLHRCVNCFFHFVYPFLSFFAFFCPFRSSLLRLLVCKPFRHFGKRLYVFNYFSVARQSQWRHTIVLFLYRRVKEGKKIALIYSFTCHTYTHTHHKTSQ